jgi:O-antigen/teichoic acid export membrane protein
VASAIVVAGLLLFARPLAGIFADNSGQLDSLTDLIRLGAAYVPLFALLQVVRYCTQAYKTMVPSVIAGNIVQPIVRFVIGFAGLIAGFAVAGLVVTLEVSVVVALVVAYWFFLRMLTADERAAPMKTPVRPMVRFALPQGGSSLLGIQTLGLGVLIVGAYESSAEAGLFAAALMLQGPGTVFLGGILNIWAPVVSDLHGRGDIARLETMYQTITRWVATFSFPVWAMLILEADVFVRLFGGDEALGAEPIVAILAIGNFFYTGTGPTGYVLSMTGRPGINFVNSIGAVILYVALGAVIVPRYGAPGMAVVDSVVTAVINTIRVVEAKILVGVQPFGRSMLKPIGATAAGAAFLLAWRLVPAESLWLEVAGIVLAAAVYVLVLKLLGLDDEERYVWNRIRRRALRGRGKGSALEGPDDAPE